MTPALPTLTPTKLEIVIRALLLRGNFVGVIEVSRDGRIEVLPAAGYDLTGAANPQTWRYRVDLAGPSRTVSLTRPGNGIVHVRLGATSGQPWAGVSPLTSAGLTAATLARIEASMRDESGARVGYLLPIPEGLADPSVDALREDLKTMRGQVALTESTLGGLGSGRQNAPQADWTPKRFGPAIPQHNVELRVNVGANIVAALGIPSVLFDGENGGGMREAYRQLLAATINPLANLIGAELSEKLERPVAFSFNRLAAADVAARARAYGSLVTAQMAPDRAERLAGLEE